MDSPEREGQLRYLLDALTEAHDCTQVVWCDYNRGPQDAYVNVGERIPKVGDRVLVGDEDPSFMWRYARSGFVTDVIKKENEGIDAAYVKVDIREEQFYPAPKHGLYELDKTDNCPSPEDVTCLCQYSGERLDEGMFGPLLRRDQVHRWIETVRVDDVQPGDNTVRFGPVLDIHRVYDSPGWILTHGRREPIEEGAQLDVKRSKVFVEDEQER